MRYHKVSSLAHMTSALELAHNIRWVLQPQLSQFNFMQEGRNGKHRNGSMPFSFKAFLWRALTTLLLQGIHMCRKNKLSRSENMVLRQACLKGWSLLGIWEFGFQEGLLHSPSDQNGSLCLIFSANNMIGMEHLLYRCRLNFDIGRADGAYVTRPSKN